MTPTWGESGTSPNRSSCPPTDLLLQPPAAHLLSSAGRRSSFFSRPPISVMTVNKYKWCHKMLLRYYALFSGILLLHHPSRLKGASGHSTYLWTFCRQGLTWHLGQSSRQFQVQSIFQCAKSKKLKAITDTFCRVPTHISWKEFHDFSMTNICFSMTFLHFFFKE